jgi:thiamine-monophosphate kinase
VLDLTAPHLTEDDLIASLARVLGEAPRAVRVGIGDDAAAWKTPGSHLSLLTTDMLVDGVHFRRAGTSPEDLGRKALAVNLSDIAAMGGRPAVAVVALGLTDAIDAAWLTAFYRGMAALAREAHCAIVGGDIVRASELTIGVTVAGDVRRTRMRLRSGAKAGDIIAVTGALGLAAAGLRVIDAGVADGLSATVRDAVCGAYLRPAPRLREGAFLGGSVAVHAMMDVSDGISTDVARMAAGSGLDAVIDVRSLSPGTDLAAAAAAVSADPIVLMLDGGDDYELLVAVARRSFAHVARALLHRCGTKLWAIGRFEGGGGAVWAEDDSGRRPLPRRGYDHMATKP